MFQADLEKRARERLAEANAAIALAEARAQAEVRRTQIETENHTKQAQSRVENEILKERNATAMQVSTVFCVCFTLGNCLCCSIRRAQHRSTKSAFCDYFCF